MDKNRREMMETHIENLFDTIGVKLGDNVQFLDDYIYVEFDEPNDKYRMKYPPSMLVDGYSFWDFYVYILEQIVRRKYTDKREVLSDGGKE